MWPAPNPPIPISPALPLGPGQGPRIVAGRRGSCGGPGAPASSGAICRISDISVGPCQIRIPRSHTHMFLDSRAAAARERLLHWMKRRVAPTLRSQYGPRPHDTSPELRFSTAHHERKEQRQLIDTFPSENQYPRLFDHSLDSKSSLTPLWSPYLRIGSVEREENPSSPLRSVHALVGTRSAVEGSRESRRVPPGSLTPLLHRLLQVLARPPAPALVPRPSRAARGPRFPVVRALRPVRGHVPSPAAAT